MKTLIKLVLTVSLAVASGWVTAQQFTPAEGHSEGEIQALDFAGSSLIIQGRRIAIDEAARVEIGGTYGAFTMLREGMMVEFWFRRYEDGSREIFELRELVGREPVLL